ncbi:MAG TPA: response regulator [Dongiaceae bacterium]|nr:response regulator [Dongiaceae bacterium]
MSAPDDVSEFLQGLRVLLVEDDPLICLDLEASLTELGAIVTAATNVGKALAALDASAFDFAVLDFELGAETSEPIAQAAQARNIPFLYLSGYSEHDERFSRWPDVRILAKPLSAARIARGIQEARQGRR